MSATGNPLQALAALGQSVWLDYIRRDLLERGELARLLAEDGVSGVTSNPSIFEDAIARHGDYQDAIAALAGRGLEPAAIYETLAIEDVQRAADLLQPVYERSLGRDGFVSLEVAPQLAFDSTATLAEAQRLWARIARPNAMIKIPGTRPGLAATRAALAAGVNVNVTLLFGVARYREVAAAFLAGLEEHAARGLPLSRVASVASFFVSRIDTLVDVRLDAIAEPALAGEARALRGAAATAAARLAYAAWREWTAEPRWQALAALGARPQRLLWASTGTKDPAYSDVKYVEALIGPDTVNTLPLATLAAFRAHGRVRPTLTGHLDEAAALPARLARLGIDLEQVAAELEAEGVRKFIEPFEKLLGVLARAAPAR